MISPNARERHHDLKLWPEYYRAKESGVKPWEYRANDRHFSVGDTVTFHEWSHADGYSGRAMGPFKITYIFNINNDLCIFSHEEPNAKDQTAGALPVRQA
jgi:hypothetical protein